MEKVFYLYVHINKINGKKYVGITSKNNPEHRWNHGNGYSQNPRFFSAIKKYGWDGFHHIIIFDSLSEESAKNMEMFYIQKWRTNNMSYGYNMTLGGDGTNGYIPSDETRKKLSNARKKENLSEETLLRRSIGLKGRKFSEEHKRKIGSANSIPVLMINKLGEVIGQFESLKLAETETGVSHSHISQCCNNKRKTAGGYIWKYVHVA